jgi:hypothetical protein
MVFFQLSVINTVTMDYIELAVADGRILKGVVEWFEI